jgi:DNA polymerase
MAAAADSLDALRAAMAAYPHCDLRLGARQLVFADGVPGARVMIVGEAPGREEDLQGKPFVGPAGQLLDKMLAAIGLNRAESVYLTNMLPWRPPQNADPTQAQLDMMRPFVERHITLAAPDIVVLMGNSACQGLLGRQGIMRMRGQWDTVLSRPALPMFHPAFLLRQPIMKREAWADLLSITARLEG